MAWPASRRLRQISLRKRRPWWPAGSRRAGGQSAEKPGASRPRLTTTITPRRPAPPRRTAPAPSPSTTPTRSPTRSPRTPGRSRDWPSDGAGEGRSGAPCRAAPGSEAFGSGPSGRCLPVPSCTPSRFSAWRRSSWWSRRSRSAWRSRSVMPPSQHSRRRPWCRSTLRPSRMSRWNCWLRRRPRTSSRSLFWSQRRRNCCSMRRPLPMMWVGRWQRSIPARCSPRSGGRGMPSLRGAGREGARREGSLPRRSSAVPGRGAASASSVTIPTAILTAVFMLSLRSSREPSTPSSLINRSS